MVDRNIIHLTIQRFHVIYMKFYSYLCFVANEF